MTVDTIKRRLVEEIKLRGYEDKYIDRAEEREILQLAITLGVTIESAQAALVEVCAEHGYVQETAVFRMIREHLDAAAGAGAIDRREFDAVFERARAAVQGKKNDRAVKAMVVAVMEDAGNRVRTGWFRNWYADLKRELGV
ncbi:MAG: hypothetical protein FJ304_14220 [Planctomycetes bacterium]|nr:hypothetical protein [Planctomycetota bacterium]